VSKVLSNIVQVDGYGAPGSSGSPILRSRRPRRSRLVRRERESQGKIIYGVPARLVADYLKRLGDNR